MKNASCTFWHPTPGILIIIISKSPALHHSAQKRGKCLLREWITEVLKSPKSEEEERYCSSNADSAIIINFRDTFCWHLFHKDSPLDLIRKAVSILPRYLSFFYAPLKKQSKNKNKTKTNNQKELWCYLVQWKVLSRVLTVVVHIALKSQPAVLSTFAERKEKGPWGSKSQCKVRRQNDGAQRLLKTRTLGIISSRRWGS